MRSQRTRAPSQAHRNQRSERPVSRPLPQPVPDDSRCTSCPGSIKTPQTCTPSLSNTPSFYHYRQHSNHVGVHSVYQSALQTRSHSAHTTQLHLKGSDKPTLSNTKGLMCIQNFLIFLPQNLSDPSRGGSHCHFLTSTCHSSTNTSVKGWKTDMGCRSSTTNLPKAASSTRQGTHEEMRNFGKSFCDIIVMGW